MVVIALATDPSHDPLHSPQQLVGPPHSPQTTLIPDCFRLRVAAVRKVVCHSLSGPRAGRPAKGSGRRTLINHNERVAEIMREVISASHLGAVPTRLPVRLHEAAGLLLHTDTFMHWHRFSDTAGICVYAAVSEYISQYLNVSACVSQ